MYIITIMAAQDMFIVMYTVQKEKKKVMNRLSRAIGHLEAVKRMVERDEDCSEVLIQLAAVRSAMDRIQEK